MQRLFLAVAFLVLLRCAPAAAVGFQWASAPNPDSAPLQVAIWYPGPDQTSDNMVGPFKMEVALNGAVEAGIHPLIVISHGTGGMALNYYETAIALAKAGFVVAAVTHTGDNYRDQSSAFTRRNFADRSRHVSRVIDFMLAAWAGHGTIDPTRIGVFGHSAGGATALIVAGGIADMNRTQAFCRTATEDWGCRQARQRGVVAAGPGEPISGRDTRVKAIVLAAPALAVAFQPNGLAGVKVPVQLWVGGSDGIITDAASIRTLLPVPSDYHMVARAGHFAYLPPCNEIMRHAAPAVCEDPSGFDRPAFLGTFNPSVVAFYRASLHVTAP